MYEAFYGLAHKPFQLNPDPAFYYDSKQHRRAVTAWVHHDDFVGVPYQPGVGPRPARAHPFDPRPREARLARVG